MNDCSATMLKSVVVGRVSSRSCASCDLLIGRFCGAIHSLSVARGTGAPWVSCREPPMCKYIQGDVTAERQPAAVLLLCVCLRCRAVLVLCTRLVDSVATWNDGV